MDLNHNSVPCFIEPRSQAGRETNIRNKDSVPSEISLLSPMIGELMISPLEQGLSLSVFVLTLGQWNPNPDLDL